VIRRRPWLLPVALLAVGGVVSLALRNRWDTWLYYEVRVPLVPIAVGVIAAVVALVVPRRADRARRSADDIRAAALGSARDERRQLVRRLDHEIKNPVTAIRAGVANIAAMSLPAGAAAAVTSVDEQAQRLSRLVGDLRKLADLEQFDIERETVDLAEVVGDVANAVEDLPGAESRTLQTFVPEVPWRVGAIAGDPDLVFLAVMNLVSNALKFSDPGARIELRALEEDRHAAIEVADNGVGIPADELPHVWEELSRGEAARAVPGSGIGLALVRTIVERHGGDVSIRSQPGKGTVVRLRFPMTAPP